MGTRGRDLNFNDITTREPPLIVILWRRRTTQINYHCLDCPCEFSVEVTDEERKKRLSPGAMRFVCDGGPAVDPAADLPFTVKSSGKLQFTAGFAKMLVYTKDGVMPTRSPKDPMFFVGPSLWKVEFGDKRRFAESRLEKTANTRRVTVKSTQAIAIDGLDGFESLAVAEEDRSGTPLVLYQVILFDEGTYIAMLGLVGADLGDEYLPQFKAMARSLRRKRR